METHIIETFGLTRRYKDFLAVHSLDLRVPEGAVYGFLGPNGAGKTTSIRMLLGLIRPSAGKVQLFGMEMAAGPARTGLLRQVGALVETPALYPHLTGRENLEVTRRLLDADRKHIDRALGVVSLIEAADRPVRTYSQGMKQRLGLALALLNQPKLLILDEPTNGLDPAGIHEIRDLIRRMPAEHGITVFLSSHLLSEIEIIATHLGIIRQGRLLFQGTLESLQAQRESHLMLGVRQSDEAMRYLAQSGWAAERVNGYVHVGAHSQADAAAINTALVEHGMHIYHLSLEQPSLEEVFLQMTDEPAER